jgi:hypothetical protein
VSTSAVTTGDGLLVDFGPVRVGPWEIAGLPVAGVLLALGFLLSLSLALRLGRRRDVPPRTILLLHLAAVPAVLAGSRLPALAARWRLVLEAPSGLREVALAPPSVLAGLLAGLTLTGLLAWMSARPARDLADVISPGLLLGLAAWSAAGLTVPRAGTAVAALGLAVAGAGAVVAARAAATGRRPGEAWVASVEALGLSALIPGAAWSPDERAGRVVLAFGLALLLASHAAWRAVVRPRPLPSRGD